MEQAGYWLWTKRKHNYLNNSHFTSSNSYDDSWEEQAFAEDAAGPLGGCIWPPRSYTCSFCKKEFSSAQALGGHMNVHRRDRARLKQSSSSPQNEIHHQSNNPFASLGLHQSPSHHQLSTFVYNPNPKSDPVAIASPSLPSRVSSAQEKTFMIPFLSTPTVQEQQHKSSPISSPDSWSSLSAYHKNNSRTVESACRVKADYVKIDLSVSLNLEEAGVRCKRRKIEPSPLPFFLKPSSIDDKEHKLLNPSSIEDLDLELRLGDPPKVIR